MKILVIGRSDFFCKSIRMYYPNASVEITSWRSPTVCDINFDLILLVGFDYSIYHKKISFAIESNINRILKLLSNFDLKLTKIIYIDTADSKKKYTLSRYVFLKKKLADELFNMNGVSLKIYRPHAIVDANNNLLIKGGNFQKFIFKLLIDKFKLPTSNYNDFANFLAKSNEVLVKPNCPSELFVFLPRTQIIDRFLRLIYA